MQERERERERKKRRVKGLSKHRYMATHNEIAQKKKKSCDTRLTTGGSSVRSLLHSLFDLMSVGSSSASASRSCPTSPPSSA